MRDDLLDEELTSVFSILPQNEAREAREFVLNRLKQKESEVDDDLVWADFGAKGELIRCGISSITDHSTKLLPVQKPGPLISAMADKILNGGADAGHIEWDANLNLLFWYVPITPTTRTEISDCRLRGFAISELLFLEFVEIFNANAGLSKAEARTLFQFVAGASLRDIATADGLAYETKRTHLKNACGKLSCAGQRELTVKLLGQMVHFISISEGEVGHVGFVEPFVQKYLGELAELHSRRLSNGRIVNYIQCGPKNGRPVVLAHGILFPILLKEAAEFLEQHSFRIITPIREGFLESAPASDLFDHDDIIQRAVEDLSGLIREYVKQPCTIVGNSTGTQFAVHFAKLQPTLVSSLILLSPSLPQLASTNSKRSGKFFGAVRGLVTNTKLFKTVTWRFKKYYLDEKTCKSVLTRLYSTCPADIAALEQGFEAGSTYQMFSDVYTSSVRGVAADFGFDAGQWREELSSVVVPVAILHGEHDPLLAAAELERFLGPELADTLTVFQGGGHLLCVTEGARVWDEISDFCEKHPVST